MIFDADSSILVIFCRRPRLGIGKQRIAADMGAPKALEISELLLAAALEDAADWQGTVVIAPADGRDSDWAAGLLPGARVIAQQGANLGERIRNIDQQIREWGGHDIVFVGSDAPALTPHALQSAASTLTHNDIVLIPARDGGVTLMGSRRPWPELSELPWETPELAEALQSATTGAGYSTVMLEESYDIDTRDDLAAAIADLGFDKRRSRRRICAWIERELLPKSGGREKLSVIIPVLGDLPALDGLLARLQANAEADEIVVVDGGASNECARLCEIRNAVYVRSGACRGTQLDAGVAASSGAIVWFLHADSEPAANAASRIREHLDKGFDGGFFRFRFAGQPGWHKTVLALAINLRARFGMPYGDQGLFMRREAYELAGGFATAPLFEEVSLVRNLRRDFHFQGINVPIGVSPRRWERDGWLRRTLHNRYLALAYMLGVPAESLARQYRRAERVD
jgi:rSAM/selenodomain-associated transferase 2